MSHSTTPKSREICGPRVATDTSIFRKYVYLQARKTYLPQASQARGRGFEARPPLETRSNPVGAEPSVIAPYWAFVGLLRRGLPSGRARSFEDIQTRICGEVAVTERTPSSGRGRARVAAAALLLSAKALALTAVAAVTMSSVGQYWGAATRVCLVPPSLACRNSYWLAWLGRRRGDMSLMGLHQTTGQHFRYCLEAGGIPQSR
jgi:hypothetical protein